MAVAGITLSTAGTFPCCAIAVGLSQGSSARLQAVGGLLSSQLQKANPEANLSVNKGCVINSFYYNYF